MIKFIKEFKFTLASCSLWMAFIIWSVWFTNKCVEGVYRGCEMSSGFIESFNVINMMAMIVFLPLLFVSLAFDCA